MAHFRRPLCANMSPWDGKNRKPCNFLRPDYYLLSLSELVLIVARCYRRRLSRFWGIFIPAYRRYLPTTCDIICIMWPEIFSDFPMKNAISGFATATRHMRPAMPKITVSPTPPRSNHAVWRGKSTTSMLLTAYELPCRNLFVTRNKY